MKHGLRSIIGGVGLCLALAVVLGCSRSQHAKVTGKVASGSADLVIDLGNKVGIRFVWIDPMQLYVGKYEVSNKEYRRFKPDHNSGLHKTLDLNQDDQPVVNVSWTEARGFCEWLTRNNGLVGGKRYRFRLPTEKEWETFASSGQMSEYPWGPNWPPPKNWNYYGIENPESGQKLDSKDGFRVSCPVQQSGKNAWGLCGVGGNVWEWCEDTDGETQSRVFKGASWLDCNPYFLVLSRRSSYAPDNRSTSRGFRVVADASDVGIKEQKRLETDQR